MTTSGAPKRPSFKRSSPGKKSRLRTRRVAAGGREGEAEAEAAGTSALARALLPASVGLDAVPPVGRALPRDFFEVDALDLAPRLLGKLLRRDEVVLRITEVCLLLHKSRVFSYDQDFTLLK
jgi:DNA-3-methyladenine glycosylase